MSAEITPHALLWLDLETTGLDPRENIILEIAWRLTSFAYPYEAIDVPGAIGSQVAKYSRDVRPLMLPEVIAMHKASGLLAAVEARRAEPASTNKKYFGGELPEASLLTLSQDWPLDKGARVMLAGNSVDFDRGFLRRHMPHFAARLSHRVFDASAFYWFCRSLGMPELPKPDAAHRAELDVLASIELARKCANWVAAGRRTP